MDLWNFKSNNNKVITIRNWYIIIWFRYNELMIINVFLEVSIDKATKVVLLSFSLSLHCFAYISVWDHTTLKTMSGYIYILSLSVLMILLMNLSQYFDAFLELLNTILFNVFMLNYYGNDPQCLLN